jgi:hypothetical protein
MAGARRFWLWLSLSVTPVLIGVTALWLQVLEIDPHAGLRVAADASGSGVLLAVGGVAVLCALVAAPSPSIHFFGYAFWAISLAVGVGYIGVRALINHLGGLQGEVAGPVWVTVVLAAAAAALLFALLALMVHIVVELREQGIAASLEG